MDVGDGRDRNWLPTGEAGISKADHPALVFSQLPRGDGSRILPQWRQSYQEGFINLTRNIIGFGSKSNAQVKHGRFNAEKSAPITSDFETEISKLVEQDDPKSSPKKIERDIDRIRSSLARLTSSSIDGLEGLTSELQELQVFLKSEVERVQGEIESALAGITIIVETIAPWKSNPISLTPPTNPRVVRAGPAASVNRSAGGKT